MHSLWANVFNETEKQIWRKKTVYFLLLSALLPIAAAILISSFQTKFGLSTITAFDYPIFILGMFTSFVLPLFIFMSAADVFAGEISSRTLKITLVRPISRFNVYLSKHISLVTYIALYLAAAGIASTLSGLFFAAQGNMLRGIADAVLAYVVTIVPFIALSFAAVFAAQFFRSASASLVVCILLYLAIAAVSFFLPQVSVYSITSYTGWHQLWLSGAGASGRITGIFMFLAACSILFFTAGFYLFDRKEL